MSIHEPSVRDIGPFDRHTPPPRFRALLGARTGLIRGLYSLACAGTDPRLSHFFVTLADPGRLVGAPPEFKARVGGVGLDHRDAVARVVGEIVERLSAVQVDADSIEWSTYREIIDRGDRALAPDVVRPFSDYQYRQAGFPFERMRDDTRLGWVRATCLLTGQPVFVPAQLMLMSYKRRADEPPIGYGTSSGCAAALSPEDAVLRAIYEQVERDAVMIHWYARLCPPRLDTTGASGDLLRLLQRGFLTAGSNFQLRCIELDIPISIYLGLAIHTVARKKRSHVSAAASLSPSQAAFKALLELGQGVQYMHYHILENPFAREDEMSFIDLEDNLRYYASPSNVHKLEFLSESVASCSISEAPERSTGDVHGDLRKVLRALAERRMTPVALDVTDDVFRELGFTVAKVYVPELCQLGSPRYPFLGSPRLYRVGAELGLSDRVLRPEDVNPDIHPFP